MDNLRQQVEYVARAFYDVQEEAPDWDNEPEFLKEEFREYARDALALLEQRREQLLDAA
jgi:mRNA deadenylase 3'-5' endonuclease subunit Ccr4